jgi:4-amino-4-deoxy-L-arabinose transferase-like glycosyltransferase
VLSPTETAHSTQGCAAAWWWGALLALAAFTYLYGLDGQHIPRIGDEMPYAQVTRMTAASGRLLPLRAVDPALENTKPPLLFWMGIAATDGGRTWTLWRLRFPIVVTTFLCALFVFALGRRLAGTGAGLLSAVVFLGWFSTFRYGRPFLTNLPETLFVFAPFALAVESPARLDRWWFWIVNALYLGFACWVKSFALVAPVGLAYAWWMLARRGWRWGEFFRRDAAKLAFLGVVGLGLFLLWPLLDPEGGAVFQQFVGRENLGKLGSEGSYFVEMFAGRHSVWRTWFGHLVNAGLYAPLFAFLAVGAWRDRRNLSEPEKALWILVLAFLVAYTIPTHRQENYLLPTVPALAILSALRWQAFGKHAWRISSIVTLVSGLVACAFVLLVVVGTTGVAPSDYSALDLAVPPLVVLGSLVGLVRWRAARFTVPLAVLLAYASIACIPRPFEGPKGRFDAATQARLGRVVLVPSNFRVAEESYRFLLPRAEPVAYDLRQGLPQPPPSESRFDLRPAILRASPGETPKPAGHPRLTWIEVGRRLTLESRLDSDALRGLLIDLRIDTLVREDVAMVPTFR